MNRIKVLRVIYFLILFAIVFRLFHWQVVKADELQAMAESQHQYQFTISAERGTIYSSDASILAGNESKYILFANPKIVKDKEDLAKELAQVILDKSGTLKGDELQEFLSLKNNLQDNLSQDLFWVPLKKDVDQSLKERIEKLKKDSLGFENQTSRFYPESSTAAHILGFVGSDTGGVPTGYFGVEGFYNRELKGKSGAVKEERDANGLPILLGKFLKREPTQGHNLVLNIDRSVQYLVEKKLKEGMDKFGAKSGSVVIMDPKTGAILALASYPSYDPANFSKFPKEYYRNPVVADLYEPGSTFKVLVMAAALQEGVVKPDTKCDNCMGPLNIGGFTIRTWNNQYKTDSTMTDVIIHSDNTGMVFAAKKLGMDKMYQYIHNFGFGNLTNIDLQDESSPDLRSKKDWHEIDLATSSFGQGIAVTPIQMIRAVTTIASGGKLFEPHIVKSIQTKDQTIEIRPKVVASPINEETAKKVTEMMVRAVSEGEAKVFAPKGFRIAGKTGTAQIPVAGHYDSEKTIASFVGFAPADDPKFVMLVRYTEPSSSIFGAETAAPTFFEIAKELFTYYKIAPSE